MTQAAASVTTVPIFLQHIEGLLAMADQADERELLSTAARSIAELLGDRASCVLIDETPRVALSTHAPSLADWPISLDKYPEITACIERRAVVTIEDAHEHPLLQGVRELLPQQLRSIAVVPLLSKHSCLGVFIAQSPMPRRFETEAVATALLVANLAAQLVELVRRGRRDTAAYDSLGQGAELPRKARRILIVEDDPDLGEDLARLLHCDEHYEVSIVQDGAAALASAKEHPPDLVLLDVLMPGIDGYTTATRLAEDPRTCDVPILFLSAAADLISRVRELKLRTADFLSKPFTRRELLARVDRSMQHLALRERLRQAAYTDELTGLGNLRLFHDRLAIEEARSARYGTPLALVIIDVDRLKKINDEHGHAAGSEALKAVASVLRDRGREMDVPVRYGGDEFVVLLPHAMLADGCGFAQRVQERLRDLRPMGLAITVSIGIAATIAGHERSLSGLLEKADAALYRAKHLGGDRACADDSTPTLPIITGTGPRDPRVRV